MKRKRHNPEQIIRKLRSAEQLLNQGQTVADVCRDLVNRHRNGAAIAICRMRTQDYEKALHAHPKRWSQSTRCWRQPVVVWINKPPEGHLSNQALLFIQAA
jgi:hypothetical protein